MNTKPTPEPKHELPKVELGKTGLRVSRLAFGTGTGGWQGRSDQGDLGVDQLAGLLQQAYAHAVDFWDTADAYGTHPHVARALQDIPRDQVVILSKILATKKDQAQADLDRFLKEMDTDYIDIILLHVMTHSDWPRHYAGVMEALSGARQQGKVRALGVSCHSFSALEACVDADWCEVVMARINYAGVNMDASPEKVVPVLEQLYNAGKAIYGMKILGNGRLSNDVEGAVEYALKLGTVHALTIGIMDQEQLLENIRLVSKFSSHYPPHS